jgi:hypothetical protein
MAFYQRQACPSSWRSGRASYSSHSKTLATSKTSGSTRTRASTPAPGAVSARCARARGRELFLRLRFGQAKSGPRCRRALRTTQRIDPLPIGSQAPALSTLKCAFGARDESIDPPKPVTIRYLGERAKAHCERCWCMTMAYAARMRSTQALTTSVKHGLVLPGEMPPPRLTISVSFWVAPAAGGGRGLPVTH